MSELMQPKQSVRDREALQKRNARSESARIVIPECKNPHRRYDCLQDPQLFLKTYFGDRYRLDFNEVHRFIIESIVSRASGGGRQAIAAPRGIGKSEATKGVLVYLVLAGLVRFPLAVAATTSLAERIFKDFKRKLETNELLYEDFPEVCHPIRALEGAPQRSARQHVDGTLTRIVWGGDYISLPHVDGSPYGGIKMAYYGLDAAFRGVNIEADRPDFVLIDDPETRESAKSEYQSEDRESILDQDIAGLASQDDSLSIVVLTTVQNRTSLSFRLTDPQIKPAWNGRRFAMVERWPNASDLWEKYCELRKNAQVGGDRYGLPAVEFYEQHREKMDDGAKLISNHFVPITTPDGRETVLSAIQQAYNKICDTNLDSYRAEYQNDPPETVGPQGAGLTAEIVASRLSGLDRFQLPVNTSCLTVGIDLGKYRCHWVVCAWWKGAGGCVVDYGVAEVLGTSAGMDSAASEPAIYKTLLNWRETLLSKEYVDAAGTRRTIDAVFVDSGAFTNAAYEFVRQVQSPFFVAKGVSPYRAKTRSTPTTKAGDNMHATYLESAKVWLFDLNADYWKNWIHERFLTPNFDDNNMLRPGSLSLFMLPGNQRHVSYAHHITAEELVREFREGKGARQYWHVANDNNHWLDATYYAAAAARFGGVELLSQVPEVANVPKESPTPKPASAIKRRPKHGPNLQRRPGGWMQSIRRR